MSQISELKNATPEALRQESLKLNVSKIDPRELAITAVGKFYNKV